MNDVFLATNGTLDLYQTYMSMQFTEMLNSRENYGYFENAMVVELREKDTPDRLAYAVVSRDYKDFYFSFSNQVEFKLYLKVFKSDKDEERNIINMAKTRSKKTKRNKKQRKEAKE